MTRVSDPGPHGPLVIRHVLQTHKNQGLFGKGLKLVVILCLSAVVEEPPKEVEPENPEEETRRNLAFLLEKVEGCSVS